VAEADDKIRLYLALLDQLSKYNTIVWQVPTALAAANLIGLDRFMGKPWVLLILALFDAVLIFAFYKLVLQQCAIIRAIQDAEAELSVTYPKYIPRFARPRISSRWLIVGMLAAADIALAVYALARLVAGS
jgi:hypothetical protein